MDIDRKALVWAANPDPKEYPEDHRYVGSIESHIAHLRQPGKVYWGLFPPTSIRFNDLTPPLCGYIYSTESGRVEHKVRIAGVEFDSKPKYPEHVPSFRASKYVQNRLLLLIDQIDVMNPPRHLNEFRKFSNEEPIGGPMGGSLAIVKDPLY